MNRRIDKISHEISKIVGTIIKEFHPLASVIKTEVTPKLTNAYVFISIYDAKSDTIFKDLKQKETFIRKELASKLKTRYVPNIILMKDKGMEHSSKIEELLKTLK